MRKGILVSLLALLYFSNDLYAQIEQKTQGYCSPAFAHIEGDITIICSDPKLAAILEKIERLQSEQEGAIAGNALHIKAIMELLVAMPKDNQYTSKVVDALYKGDVKEADRYIKLIDFPAADKKDELAAAKYRQSGLIWYLEDSEKSIEAFQKAAELNPDNPEAWHYLGNLFHREKNFTQATNAFYSLKKLSEKRGDKIWLHRALQGLGEVYFTQGDYDNAEKYSQNALCISQELGYKLGMSVDYSNLGDIFVAQKKFDKARDSLIDALIIDVELESSYVIIVNYTKLAWVYENQENFANLLLGRGGSALIR